MMTQRHYAIASRIGVSVTLPELEKDIDAQLRALADPEHPKTAVFLARGNSLGGRILPDGLFVETRSEGTLITTEAAAAQLFRQAEYVTDADLARFLGYPEPKTDVLLSDDGMVVQTLDAQGCVIFEAAATQNRVQHTVDAAEAQKPWGGRVVVTTPQAALARRFAGMN